MTRRGMLALTLTLLAGSLSSGPVAAQVAAPQGPAGPVAALNDGLLAVMHAGRGVAFAQRVQMFRPVAERSFDLTLILQNSVGPRWTSLSAEMRGELLEVFTQFTVASWVGNFDAYDGERFQILPERRQVGGDEVVQTRLIPKTGDVTRLDYVMRRAGDGWRVVDILLDGSISRVAVQRTDFRALLQGGDAAPLVASLRQKVAAMVAAG